MSIFNITALYSRVFGYVAPPYPAIGDLGDQLTPGSPRGLVQSIGDQYGLGSAKNRLGEVQIMPLTLEGISVSFTFPLPPMVSVSCRHKIIRRYPNKPIEDGSIKERWSGGDYRIQIKGIFLNQDTETYPNEEVGLIKQIFESRTTLAISKKDTNMLTAIGIDTIVIERLQLPHTPGLHGQAYVIDAYSDHAFDLIVSEN